jgi:DNA-nicking Smr family endonuclease
VRALSEEERALWRSFAADIVPLRGGAAASPPPPPAPRPTEAAKAVARAASSGREISTPPPEPDRKTKRALRRGALAFERKIDLHGLTQAEAHRVLEAAVTGGRARRLLVVTGRGRAKAEGGVLRRMLPRWLAEPGLARHVVSLGVAAPGHGGDGAFYLLLRRRKS